ncbi:MAG: hypothetical protein Q4B03_06375 [Lachnospiraceae bacterium]|nr:hypothetical protein [Lachnospiraceae bacterium]
MSSYKINVQAKFNGLDDVMAKTERLLEKMQEARTLYNELASAMESLNLDIQTDGCPTVRTDV